MNPPAPSPLSVRAKLVLSLGALGVVFGDIGTSPLYTMKECRDHLPAGIDPTAGVLGILSLMFWALVIVVCVKYLMFVTRADNDGEGGIFALLALLQTRTAPQERGMSITVVLILIGAALLYGDGVITPAISVLGAAEGLTAINPAFEHLVPGVAAGILAVLFWFQHKGTHRIGSVFGPVMLLWFGTLAGFGIWHLAHNPGVLRAVNPGYGLALLKHRPVEIAALLGAVVLTITGAEALYADMGHFSRKYIAWAWYGAAFPGLLLNYFGQGAFLLAHPQGAENPFFALAPPGFPRAALTGLSFAAAIIASQALISGAYSLTRQAIQLGYFPRLRIAHTNAEHAGQIYVPFVNQALAIGSIATVLLFSSTANLAAAYGIAVTGTMAITTIAFYLVVAKRWRWNPWKAGAICAAFLLVDLGFFGANARKIHEGGWFPLAIGVVVLATMHTWKVGRSEIYRRVYGSSVTEPELTGIARSKRITRVSGAAVFMAGSPHGTPIALLHHVKSNRALHETVLLLSLSTIELPHVAETERLELIEIGEGIWRVIGRYGYMESPDATALLQQVAERGVPINPAAATYIFNREMIMGGGDARMPEWQKHFYGFLSRNARPAKDYYKIPPSQIIEIGLPVHL
ncbi:MAG: KUP/HAK/KT family potassium transporter [Opitutaceae bacterium]|nr:KUP/HAK/KT family potassium transporter [Opitutaceae bacterium]